MSRDSKPTSIFWVLMWSLSFSLMMAVVKHLKGAVSPPMIGLVRLGLGFLYFLPIVFHTGIAQMRTTQLPFHGMRVILSLSAMGCTYYAYSHLPLASATAIGFVGPIMTMLLSVVFLRDRVSWLQWFLVFVGYVGVLIIVAPQGATGASGGAALAALGANFFASANLIAMRKLSQKDTTTQIVFWSNLLSVSLLMCFSPLFWKMPTAYEWKWLMLLSFAGVFSQVSYAQALRYSPPSFVAPFEYSRLLFAIPLGLAFFGEQLSAGMILGGLIIIVANAFLTVIRSRQDQNI